MAHEAKMNNANDLVSAAQYNVQSETQALFENGLLRNPLISKDLPKEALDLSKYVAFSGHASPSIPINWRFAESISSIKALEATMLNVLLQRKYSLSPRHVTINTDHATLFVMSTLIWRFDPSGENIGNAESKESATFQKYFPSKFDLCGDLGSPYRSSATNIYKCKDGRYFHLHGSMNAQPTLKSLKLPGAEEVASAEEAWPIFADAVGKIDSGKMQRLASDEYKQAGTICWTPEEYRNSEHGKANAHVGLYEIHGFKNEKQKACWWPNSDSPKSSAERPLAGLKVVDLTRVIAAPAITRGLAELGASVMRVTAPHITDFASLHLDLNWGKWNCFLDFREEADREKLRNLVREADVVVQGYRPDVLCKYGFSTQGLHYLVKDRERGLIVVNENCYGWNGPWSYRSGWQQISDACCGVSMEFGRAMGNDEPVTPVFPNSDYCTGSAGVIAILDALMRRASDGGSYTVDIALNYYSQWLVNSCGTYPPAVWEDLWSRYGKPVFRHYHNMPYTLPRFLRMMAKESGHILFRPEFMEDRENKYVGSSIRTVKPVLQFPDGKVKLGYNVGTRSNGVDLPYWPKDLMTEVVS